MGPCQGPDGGPTPPTRSKNTQLRLSVFVYTLRVYRIKKNSAIITITMLPCLSEVFPKNTVYYYGFPAGSDSGFYNACPPEIEELVAMRSAVCAGANMKVVVFSSTVEQDVWNFMRDDLGTNLVSREQLIVLPASINTAVLGAQRNEQTKRALAELVPDGALIMAQPYIDQRLEKKYLISPNITTWLNDKNNIEEMVPQHYRVLEFARARNGKNFSTMNADALPYPCVVKISSSSSGNGVIVCANAQELKHAQHQWKDMPNTIIIQKRIETPKEIDIKFAIHQDRSVPFEILGYSDEINKPNGEYLGGIVRCQHSESRLIQNIRATLLTTILPIIQQKGWFGVGGVDVLIDKNGQYYFNDFNCRMTATMAQTMQANQGDIQSQCILVFNGTFLGSLNELKEKISPIATHQSQQQRLNIVALAHDKNEVRLHAGILFDDNRMLKQHITTLQRLGIRSEMFDHLPYGY